MKPQMQKIVDKDKGDCFGACIASILELDDWPNFDRKEHGPWMDQWNDWLKKWGLEILYVPGGHPPPSGYALMVIKSVNILGADHSVVWKGEGWGNGQVIHDPSPLKHPEEYNPIGYYCFGILDASKMVSSV